LQSSCQKSDCSCARTYLNSFVSVRGVFRFQIHRIKSDTYITLTLFTIQTETLKLIVGLRKAQTILLKAKVKAKKELWGAPVSNLNAQTDKVVKLEKDIYKKERFSLSIKIT